MVRILTWFSLGVCLLAAACVRNGGGRGTGDSGTPIEICNGQNDNPEVNTQVDEDDLNDTARYCDGTYPNGCPRGYRSCDPANVGQTLACSPRPENCTGMVLPDGGRDTGVTLPPPDAGGDCVTGTFSDDEFGPCDNSASKCNGWLCVGSTTENYDLDGDDIVDGHYTCDCNTETGQISWSLVCSLAGANNIITNCP